jgi:hypothetical protein
MQNLIDSPAHAKLRIELETELQRQLERNGDTFPTAEEALKQWGYEVESTGEIPYRGEFRVQTPGPDTGEICRFGR